MSDNHTPDDAELQFDRVISGHAAADASQTAVTCRSCGTQLVSEYYEVNGFALCDTCRRRIVAHAESGRGTGRFAIAALFGLGAGIVGAAIYFAVIAITKLEIGLVAILIGYMVGWSVRKGAGGRGGRRFQVLAALLTYLSVALAYTPVVIGQAIQESRKEAQDAKALPPSPEASADRSQPDRNAPVREDGPRPGAIRAIGALVGLLLTLPVLIIWSSMPGGLISALIIFFGISQAWRMTAAPIIDVHGPFRVGSAAGETPPA